MKDKKKRFITKTKLFTHLVAMVLLFSLVIAGFTLASHRTLGWFASMLQSLATGMNVQINNRSFELKSENGTIENEDMYSFIDSYISSSTSTITSSEHETIRWRVTDSYDSLLPGSQGVLEFRIITNGKDVSEIRYSIDFNCFTAETHLDAEENEIVDSISEITESSSHTSEEKNGADFLKTHILFFTGRTGTDESNYQFNGFVEDISDFTLNPVLVGENEYSVTLYWIWPNTVGQLLLNSGDAGDVEYLGTSVHSVLNSIGETEDRDAMTDYLLNYNLFAGDHSYYSSLVTQLYSNRSSGINFQSEYDVLSSGYNSADLMIGNNINYVSLLLSAE